MLHFIYNPIAGNGLAAKARAAIEPRLDDIPHQFHEAQYKKHATELVRQLTASGETEIVAMGGDGTLNEVLNGLADPAKARLGLIPCGSGNDFASAAGLPADPVEALSIVIKGEAKYTDFMECSGVRGINAIGTGIDVGILRRYARMKLLKGSAAYLTSLITTVMAYRARRFEEITENGSVSHEAFIACAGNGRTIGGGIPICPDAVVDDGLLDITIVDGISRAAIPAAFFKLMKRKVGEIRTAHIARQTSLIIRSEQLMPVQVDGEIYDDLPFDVRLIHNVLRFYRP